MEVAKDGKWWKMNTGQRESHLKKLHSQALKSRDQPSSTMGSTNTSRKGKGKEHTKDQTGKGKGKERAEDQTGKGKGKERAKDQTGKGKGKERAEDQTGKRKGKERPGDQTGQYTGAIGTVPTILGLSAKDAHDITQLPPSTASGIWSKTSDLASDPQTIAKVPGGSTRDRLCFRSPTPYLTM